MTDPAIGVLVVDDEVALTDVYEAWLSEYDVYVANDGTGALSVLDEHADRVDIVLLDRKMPELSGDAVLEEIRRRDVDCRVAMITAVAPADDIVDMAFDDYLVKPVNREDVRGTVEDLRRRAEYSDALADYYALVSKHAALMAERTPGELRDSEAFAELEADIREAERTLATSAAFADHREFEYLLREITE